MADTTQAATTDAVTREVVHNRLEAIVEEMGVTMLKTAHSLLHMSCKDFSVALFTPGGHLLSMGKFIPHHQGGMESYLQAILRIFPADEMQAGDVYLINDAYLGGTHPQDVCVLQPLFVDDELVMFAGCTAHHMDIGGMTAGGYSPQAIETYQEGMIFPGVKLADAGVLREDIVRMFARNVRLPEDQRGDLLAQISALHLADLRAPGVVARYGPEGFVRICRDLLDATEERVRNEIARLPDGAYNWVDHIEHDGNNDRHYRLEVTLRIDGSSALADFTGTDPQAAGFINASLSNTRASTYAAFMLFLDPHIPHNHGFFRAIDVRVPEGTVLNPSFPAPLTGSTTEAGGRVYDLVLGALSKSDPDRGAGTWSMMWMAVMFYGRHPRTDRPFIHWTLDGIAAGGGGSGESDGWNASNISSSNCLIPNIEEEEEKYPVRYLSRRLLTDSGGAGQHRGGLVLETEVQIEVDCTTTVFGSRTEVPAPGFRGGRPGGLARVAVRSAGVEETLPAKAVDRPVRAGDSVVLRGCGGGGYGNPRRRPRHLVRADLEDGYISPEVARDVYGLSDGSTRSPKPGARKAG
jgi:N-methylhydantoinase B